MPPTAPPIESILAAAVELASEAERRQFVDRACAGDAALKRRVDELIENHFRAGSFLESPAPDLRATADEPPLREGPGTVIGPYKLMEQIGEGGMGLVFVAEQQQPVRRKVALKVIKPGMDTRQVVARFEAERQALALMDHPNIARILDGGETAAGRPYFVMELVKGAPITQFCDDNRLNPRERLTLFLDLCAAVQHAHQKGIIHRDLKPSNVLVMSHDGRPVVRVIDFGVAKAVGRHLTDKTIYTQFAQLIGTPLYMSPEQAGESGLDADTRSDIYSLGVLLYELLTGTTPFDQERLRTAGYDELRRIIREEEPARPSARISTLGQAAATLSANRQSDVRQLRRQLRGELDWIVMKALDKERDRRYQTAGAFAADVQRYLRDEPVEACPPSAWYRLGKLARRNKAAMTVAVALLAAALLAAGSFALSYRRIDESLQHERQTKANLVQALYYQHIATAAGARASEQAGRAEELLEQCPDQLRGWEWHYLKRLPFDDFPVLHHAGIITMLAVSPDGRLLAAANAAGGKGTVKMWDLQTRTALRELPTHRGFIGLVAFSPDSRLVATASAAGDLRIWDPFTGALRKDLSSPSRLLMALTFSPDGRCLAAASHDDGVYLWEVGSWRPLAPVPQQRVAFNGLAFGRDGRSLVAANRQGTVTTYDIATAQALSSFQGHIQQAWAAAFSRDRRLVALGSEDGTIKVWETDSGKALHSLEAHSGLVTGLAFLDGGRRLASCGDDRTLKVWDLATEHEALQLGVFTKRSQGLAVSPDGLRLFYRHPAETEAGDIIGIADGTPLTGRGTDRGTLVLDGHHHNVVAVAWSPDGRRLASVSWDRTAKVWDALSGRELFTLRGHEGALTDVAFSPDGRRLATASWDETVRVWDAETGKECFILPGKGGAVYGVAFHPRDDYVLASAHHDGTIRFWDTRTGQMAREIAAQNQPMLGVAFSPDGQLLAGAVGKNYGNIAVWNTASGTRQHALRQEKSGICSSIAFHPNGRFVAGVATTNDVYVWDLTTGEVRDRLPHPYRPNRVAFGPDGRLATVSMDQTVRLWQVLTKRPPVEVRGHVGDVWCAAFSPDGRRLATGAGYKGRGEVRIREAALWEKTPR